MTSSLLHVLTRGTAGAEYIFPPPGQRIGLKAVAGWGVCISAVSSQLYICWLNCLCDHDFDWRVVLRQIG